MFVGESKTFESIEQVDTESFNNTSSSGSPNKNLNKDFYSISVTGGAGTDSVKIGLPSDSDNKVVPFVHGDFVWKLNSDGDLVLALDGSTSADISVIVLY